MLVAAQEELLLARRLVNQTAAAGGSEAAVGNARELLDAPRRRLRFVDVAPADIARRGDREVGGMVSSTLLTLVVIPAVYSLWKEEWEPRRSGAGTPALRAPVRELAGTPR